ncbi:MULTISPECIES: hypothetical protein [unclassified Streptomyces]|uniref:hypothetical protein n=1 Tax=unclassified Streptomyces TaxID=2593676 RepID=UPI0033E8AFC4
MATEDIAEAVEDDTAERRLRLLRQAYLGQAGSGSISQTRSRPSRPSHSSPPVNLGLVDHVRRCVTEVEAYTRAAVPDAGPVPSEAESVYSWSREVTSHLAPQRQQAREAVIYRQGLEHAVAMGQHEVVRPHPCPACGCWGLYWNTRRQKAVCVNRRCVDEHGRGRAWPLERLASEYMTRQKMLKDQAT